MTVEETAAAAVDDVSPPARLILYDIDVAGDEIVPLSDIQARTGLPNRTIRKALTRLEERGLAERRPDPRGDRRRPPT